MNQLTDFAIRALKLRGMDVTAATEPRVENFLREHFADINKSHANQIYRKTPKLFYKVLRGYDWSLANGNPDSEGSQACLQKCLKAADDNTKRFLMVLPIEDLKKMPYPGLVERASFFEEEFLSRWLDCYPTASQFSQKVSMGRQVHRALFLGEIL